MTLVCGKEVTLPDINDKLAVIDYVRDRLLEQGVRSVTVDYEGTSKYCSFRAQCDGATLACALGWLVPDGRYERDYLADRGMMQSELACDLRHIHDDHEPAKWESLFSKLRAKYAS